MQGFQSCPLWDLGPIIFILAWCEDDARDYTSMYCEQLLNETALPLSVDAQAVAIMLGKAVFSRLKDELEGPYCLSLKG